MPEDNEKSVPEKPQPSQIRAEYRGVKQVVKEADWVTKRAEEVHRKAEKSSGFTTRPAKKDKK